MVLVLLAAVAQPDAGVSPFVARVALLALAGGAAYLLDDAAVQLTSVTPPGVWRRRAPGLSMGAGALAAAWVVVLLVLGWQDSRPPVRDRRPVSWRCCAWPPWPRRRSCSGVATRSRGCGSRR